MPGLVGIRGSKRILFFFLHSIIPSIFHTLIQNVCSAAYGAVEEGQISASHESSNFAWCAAKQSVTVFLNIFLPTCL